MNTATDRALTDAVQAHRNKPCAETWQAATRAAHGVLANEGRLSASARRRSRAALELLLSRRCNPFEGVSALIAENG
jgi:hypothetical protein